MPKRRVAGFGRICHVFGDERGRFGLAPAVLDLVAGRDLRTRSFALQQAHGDRAGLEIIDELFAREQRAYPRT